MIVTIPFNVVKLVAIPKSDKDITLVTKNKEKKLVNIKDIRIQKRAGRGTNVMVINLDDEIIETQYS